MDHDTAHQFGEYIKRLRKQREFSIRELASKAGIDSGALTRLEHGKVRTPHLNTLKALATALEVPLIELFTMVGYISPYDLPSMAPYLQARYSHLPEEARGAINNYLEQLIDEHGLDPSGPLAFEDEANQTSQR